MSKDKSLENGIAFFGGMMLCGLAVMIVGVACFKAPHINEVKNTTKFIQVDSIKYKCPHCSHEVSLTTNN